MNLLRPFLPSLLSGILLGVTTIGHGPVYHLHWAIFFGFVPLWSAWLGERSARRIFLSGWVFQFIFTLCAFHWLAFTVNEFSHMGMPLSILVLLFYCAIANLQFPLAGLAWHYLCRSTTPLVLRIATLALLTAIFQRVGTTIFHWNFGYAWLYIQWPGMQLADLFGFRGLCTISICMNGLLLLSWVNRRNQRWWRPLLTAAFLFGLVNILGWLHVQQLPKADSLARVLIVQPNIGNRDKEKLEHGEAFRGVALRRYFEQTDRALRGLSTPPDFALWPENAFPDMIVDPMLTYKLSAELKKYLIERKLNLVTGSYGVKDGKLTNSLFALTRQGEWSSPPYNKMILLPFGEYVPGAETFPVLKEWLPDVADYGRGDAPVLLSLEGRILGAQICYEGLFDSISRNIANLGAQIIVNVTNDSWYGNWMEPWQHFYITMAKAVETRRPLVRGTNTGLSAVIHADGTIPEISPIAQEWSRLVDVPYLQNPPSTVFMRWGFWIDWIFLGVGLLLVLLLARVRKTETSA